MDFEVTTTRPTVEVLGETYVEPDWDLCPSWLVEPFKKYFYDGQPTGDFLRSVLENDLITAVCRADPKNRGVLKEICVFVYNELPSACAHDRDHVRAWIQRHEDDRREKRRESSTEGDPL